MGFFPPPTAADAPQDIQGYHPTGRLWVGSAGTAASRESSIRLEGLRGSELVVIFRRLSELGRSTAPDASGRACRSHFRPSLTVPGEGHRHAPVNDHWATAVRWQRENAGSNSVWWNIDRKNGFDGNVPAIMALSAKEKIAWLRGVCVCARVCENLYFHVTFIQLHEGRERRHFGQENNMQRSRWVGQKWGRDRCHGS